MTAAENIPDPDEGARARAASLNETLLRPDEIDIDAVGGMLIRLPPKEDVSER